MSIKAQAHKHKHASRQLQYYFANRLHGDCVLKASDGLGLSHNALPWGEVTYQVGMTE